MTYYTKHDIAPWTGDPEMASEVERALDRLQRGEGQRLRDAWAASLGGLNRSEFVDSVPDGEILRSAQPDAYDRIASLAPRYAGAGQVAFVGQFLHALRGGLY